MADAEYKIGSCIVRMHGTPDREKLKEATAELLKAVQRKQMQARKEALEQIGVPNK